MYWFVKYFVQILITFIKKILEFVCFFNLIELLENNYKKSTVFGAVILILKKKIIDF